MALRWLSTCCPDLARSDGSNADGPFLSADQSPRSPVVGCATAAVPRTTASHGNGETPRRVPPRLSGELSTAPITRPGSGPHDPIPKLLCGDGSAKVEPLDHLAAKFIEELDLSGGLRSFDDDIEIERLRYPDDGAHQRKGLMVKSEPRDEAPVYLQDIEGEVAQ